MSDTQNVIPSPFFTSLISFVSGMAYGYARERLNIPSHEVREHCIKAAEAYITSDSAVDTAAIVSNYQVNGVPFFAIFDNLVELAFGLTRNSGVAHTPRELEIQNRQNKTYLWETVLRWIEEIKTTGNLMPVKEENRSVADEISAEILSNGQVFMRAADIRQLIETVALGIFSAGVAYGANPEGTPEQASKEATNRAIEETKLLLYSS